MDSLVLLSWIAYLICSFLLLLASWKLLYWLPFTLKCGVFLTQLAILVVPAAVNETALAPAFIVIVLDILMSVPRDVWIQKAVPLLVALVAAWPLAYVWGRLYRLYLTRQEARQSQEDTPENEQTN
ncbi:hypothetical protein [Marinospirillum perlucidum]|uniref:hypothetical protein n=1 Tax=Marinospirillum perlucidum TaxID=1982602 RepID=UPI000DF229BD|nr:hypothetical protein [Marinospirillum perlucidum]